MKLFEATWRDGFDFYERYFDTNLQKSFKNQIKIPYEWYEPKSTGIYSYILDETIKLDKKQGNPKQGRDQYGFLDPMYRNIRDNYWQEKSFNNNPRVWYLDIETRVGQNSTGFPVPEKAQESISLMQIFDNKLNTMFVLGLREWVHESNYNFDYTVKYIQCKDEIQLIETYLDLFKELNPLIIYAWNGLGFDYPYIYNRIKNLGLDVNRLSNYGKVIYSENTFMNKLEFSFNAVGHFYIDLMNVYKKFTYITRSSYALNNIAEAELGDKKVQHNEYAAFDDFYTGKYNIPENPTEEQKNSKIYQHAIKYGVDNEVRELAHSEFVYYGIIDTYLIKRIDDKQNFTALMCMISQKMGVQISDSLGTVKPWSQFISNSALKDKKVMPPKQEHPAPNVVGGFVREPNAGKHKWVISADVNSMYPLLGMVGFNMSPETFVPKHKLPPALRDIVLTYFNDQEEAERFKISDDIWQKTEKLLKEHNMCLGINGAVFKKDKLGMVPFMVQEIYDGRKAAKKTMFMYQQRAILMQEILRNK